MSNKKRILVVTDASFLKSGYGIYAQEILSRFHKSNEYEVAELGCYATVKNPKIKDIPWKFYPNAVENDDSRYATYNSNASNQFGAWRFNRVCAHFKPDIVLTWTDYWMYAYQETSPFRNYFYWIQMPMVDSAPQKLEWLYTFANADIVIPYTEWAKKTLIKECGSRINLYHQPANAGINPDEFYPIENKAEHKKSILGFDADIVGCVMRNQKRKLFADTMHSFRMYLDKLISDNNIEKFNKTYLYLHTTFPEANGWDFPALLMEYDLLDKVYFSYICKSCGHYFPSKFKNSLTVCPKCKTQSAFFPNVSAGITSEDLNKIYNLFDLFIQNAIAEGFGIPQLEAAACGIPFASVDYSAMTEVAENLSGFKIPVQRKFRELETNADRVYPDNDYVAQLMYDFFNTMSDEHKQNLSNKTRNSCINKYTWDNVYKVWKDCCDSLYQPQLADSQIITSKKLSWQNNALHTNHESMKVPPGLNPKEFIQYICDNILREPRLYNSSLIQMLIKDLSSRFIAKSGLLQTFDHQKAVEVLETHLNNKITCSQILNSIDQNTEDFLICHQ